MTEINKELRRKQSHMSQQMRTLVEERADLQALHQEQSRNLTALQKRLGVAQRDNEDLIQCQVTGNVCADMYLVFNVHLLMLFFPFSFLL